MCGCLWAVKGLAYRSLSQEGRSEALRGKGMWVPIGIHSTLVCARYSQATPMLKTGKSSGPRELEFHS